MITHGQMLAQQISNSIPCPEQVGDRISLEWEATDDRT